MNSVAGVLNFPVSSPVSSTNPQAKSRVDHRNTEEAALVRRVQAIDQNPAVDTRLAQRDLIGKLMGKLSSEDRSLLLLKEVEGHSVEELSQMTGMNENTIKVKLFRARQKLLKAAQRLNRGTGQTVA